MAALVGGRPGWEFGTVIQEMNELPRVAVYHRGSNIGMWVEGKDELQRLLAARLAIDEFYMKRWIQLSEQIQADDAEGGAVHVLPVR